MLSLKVLAPPSLSNKNSGIKTKMAASVISRLAPLVRKLLVLVLFFGFWSLVVGGLLFVFYGLLGTSVVLLGIGWQRMCNKSALTVQENLLRTPLKIPAKIRFPSKNINFSIISFTLGLKPFR